MGQSLKASRTLVWDPPIRPLPFRVSAFFAALACKRGQCVWLVRVDLEIRRGALRLPSGTVGFGSRDDDGDEPAFWQQRIDAWGVIASAQKFAIDVR